MVDSKGHKSVFMIGNGQTHNNITNSFTELLLTRNKMLFRTMGMLVAMTGYRKGCSIPLQ